MSTVHAGLLLGQAEQVLDVGRVESLGSGTVTTVEGLAGIAILVEEDVEGNTARPAAGIPEAAVYVHVEVGETVVAAALKERLDVGLIGVARVTVVGDAKIAL